MTQIRAFGRRITAPAMGTKKENLWNEVVAACALAPTDERGYFSSRSVQEQLADILGRPVIQQTVAFHLGKLTEASRGPMLESIGPSGAIDTGS